MALSFIKLFDPNQVDASVESLYTVPSTPATTILRNCRVRFSNTTGGSVTIKAWAVPQGGSATDSTCCLPLTPISSNEYLDVDIPVMSVGGALKAQAGAGASITASCLDGFLQS